MNEVDFMKKLLDGAEVEWKALGEVVKTVTTSAKLKKGAYCETGSIPIIDQGASFLAGYTDEDLQTLPNDNYIIFGDHSEHIKYVDFAFIQGADGLKILKPVSDSAKYIYYAFQNFYRKELSYKRHWSKSKNTIIPIPCPNNPKKSLEIQTEIVRILDTFTELTDQHHWNQFHLLLLH
jgi:type I restriction enzyme S subunit